MSTFRGERVLMRIFIAEKDRHGRRPLYCALLDLLRQEGFRGATVLRGVAGFGESQQVRSAHLLRLSQDLPLVVEAVECQKNIDRVLPKIEKMLDTGLITMEKVNVIRHGAKAQEEED